MLPELHRSWSILRSLLFPLPGAMWWLQVSAHGRDTKLDLSFPGSSAPALSSTWPWASPHPDSQLRHHSLGQEGPRSGAQRGLWWRGGLSLVGNMEKVGSWGWPPHCQGSAPARPGLRYPSLAPRGREHHQGPAAVISAGVGWVGVICSPIHGFLRVTSGARRETQPPRMLALPAAGQSPGLLPAGLNCPSHSSRNLGAATCLSPALSPPCTEL